MKKIISGLLLCLLLVCCLPLSVMQVSAAEYKENGYTYTVENGKATVHKDKCIRCFCCHEMCPVKAIKVKRRGFFNI